MHAADKPRPNVSEADFEAPIDQRYFEDYRVGAVYHYGAITVDEAEVIAFATKFDPQDIHVDPEAAARGPFGGLIASGWHTAAMTMRLFADNYLSTVASLASPGIDELRWTRPVRPGDTLNIRVTILDAKVSRSKPDRGVVRTLIEVLNQDDELAMSCKAINLLRRRDNA
jgi:acyl dehydratase